MLLNKVKYKIKFDKVNIYYKKHFGYFYIKIYNKFKYNQYIINKDPLFTLFIIIQFLYKIGVKLN